MAKRRRGRGDQAEQGSDASWLDVGWTSVPDLLTSAEIDEVIAGCTAELADPERHRPNDKIAGETQRLCEVEQRVALVDAIAQRPALTAVVSAVLGERFSDAEATFRNPRPGFGGQRLHADDLAKTDDGPDRLVTAILALVDFTADNGPTRVVPGSHRRPDLQRTTPQLEHHPDEQLLTGRAGTAFVFSGHLLHSGTINNSSSARPALQFIWRRLG